MEVEGRSHIGLSLIESETQIRSQKRVLLLPFLLQVPCQGFPLEKNQPDMGWQQSQGNGAFGILILAPQKGVDKGVYWR